jgi:hypothetical protein
MIKLIQKDPEAASIFYACLAVMYNNIRQMSDEEMLDTIAFFPPQEVREGFQSIVDALEPFKYNQ